MDGHASRRPLSHRMHLGSFATIVAASAFLVPNAAFPQSSVIVDEAVLNQQGPASRSATQPSAPQRRNNVRTEPLATVRRPDIGAAPVETRRAALKDPPATMPRSRFLAPHLATAAPKAAKRVQTAETTRKRAVVAQPAPRIVAPTPVTTPAAPRIAKPTVPNPPARPVPKTPVGSVPAITPPPPPPDITAQGGATPAEKMASLPATPALESQVVPSGDVYRLPFTGEAATLGETNSKLLDKLADRLKRDPSLRLQLLGFADSAESTSQARRVSLFRALAVRTYLMKQGVPGTRMDVRALGNRNDGAPANRVDIEIKK